MLFILITQKANTIVKEFKVLLVSCKYMYKQELAGV